MPASRPRSPNQPAPPVPDRPRAPWASLLDVELLRERRRADEVAEEHRQLAVLAVFGGRFRDGLV